MYNAQDPLGVGPNIANPRGYVGNPTTWMDPLGLHAKSQKTSKIEASPETPLRAGKFSDLSTKVYDPALGDTISVQRHHIVSQNTLKELGQDTEDVLCVQMPFEQHKATLSWGPGKSAQEYRAGELARIQSGDEAGIVLDELVRVEAMGPDNAASAYEALDLYIKHGGIHLP